MILFTCLMKSLSLFMTLQMKTSFVRANILILIFCIAKDKGLFGTIQSVSKVCSDLLSSAASIFIYTILINTRFIIFCLFCI